MSPAMEIVYQVASARGCSVRDILAKTRFREMVITRHVAIWRIHRECGLSSGQIALIMRRDPSTVRHSLRKMRMADREAMA